MVHYVIFCVVEELVICQLATVFLFLIIYRARPIFYFSFEKKKNRVIKGVVFT